MLQNGIQVDNIALWKDLSFFTWFLDGLLQMWVFLLLKLS